MIVSRYCKLKNVMLLILGTKSSSEKGKGDDRYSLRTQEWKELCRYSSWVNADLCFQLVLIPPRKLMKGNRQSVKGDSSVRSPRSLHTCSLSKRRAHIIQPDHSCKAHQAISLLNVNHDSAGIPKKVQEHTNEPRSPQEEEEACIARTPESSRRRTGRRW